MNLEKLSLIRPNNTAGRVRHFEVYGGDLYNCGESDCSKIVDESSPILESIIFCPMNTKNGGFVRPKYYVGNRTEVVVFPVLTLIVMELFLWPNEHWSHIKAAWSTPALKRLVFRVDSEDKLPQNFDVFANDLFANCPKLEEIQFIVHPLTSSYTRLDLVKPIKSIIKQ